MAVNFQQQDSHTEPAKKVARTGAGEQLGELPEKFRQHSPVTSGRSAKNREAIAGEWSYERNGKSFQYEILSKDDQYIFKEKELGVEGFIHHVDGWWQGDIKVGTIRLQLRDDGKMLSQVKQTLESEWEHSILAYRTEGRAEDLSDLFGTFSDDSDDSVEIDKNPSEPRKPKVAHSSLRRALRRIDSNEEQNALLGSADARKVGEILRSPSSAPAMMSGCTKRSCEGSEALSESWFAWPPIASAHLEVSLVSVREAVQRLKADKQAKFPAADVLRVFDAAVKPGGLISDTVIRKLEVPSGSERGAGRLLILGDTHGQLEDVLWIFFKHGEPNATDNVYLFNGDVVDRGQQAIEIIMLMMLYNLADPGSVYMNRGNHEDSYLSRFFGFHNECIAKYGRDVGNKIYEASQQIFNGLPLCSLIDAGKGSRLFVVHGGPPRKLGASLEELAGVNFKREVPDPRPGEDLLFYDCLWSDPQNLPGLGANERGPDVASFGPDITSAFLNKNDLDVIVRSHQVPSKARGIEWLHNRQLLTVFSASNYGGRYGNLGGVVTVRKGQPLETSEHWAGSFQELVNLEKTSSNASTKLRMEAMRLAERQQKRASRSKDLDKMQTYMLEHIKECVVSKKAELFEFWSKRDDSDDFNVSRDIWRLGMSQHFGCELQWELIEEKLGVVDVAKGTIPYMRFLQRFHVGSTQNASPTHVGWELSPLRCVFESLLCADLPIREAIAAFDRNNDGEISIEELIALTADCGLVLSPSQCRTLLRSFALHRTGKPGARKIKLFDFLDSITLAFSAGIRPLAAEGDEWIPKSLGKIARILMADAANNQGTPKRTNSAVFKMKLQEKSSLGSPSPSETENVSSKTPVAELLAEWFYAADADANGYLSLNEFEAALEKLSPEFEKQGLPITVQSRRALSRYMDLDGSGNINYVELLASLVPCERGGVNGELGPLGQDLAEAVATAIYLNRATLLRSLRLHFDVEGSGQVTLVAFVEALTALNVATLSRASQRDLLTKQQIEALAVELARPGDGMIRYEDFINSFRIIDKGI